MFDTEFFGEVISVYTDGDALEDGGLFDVSDLKVYFNRRIINRATIGAMEAADLNNKIMVQCEHNLRAISGFAERDGDGIDAWGTYQNDRFFKGVKFWIIPNEVEGFTIMLPEEY